MPATQAFIINEKRNDKNNEEAKQIIKYSE